MPAASIESFSLTQYAIDPFTNLFMVDKLAPVSLFNAALNSAGKLGLTLQHAINDIPDQLLGISATGRRNPLQLRLHLGRKMYFHSSTVRNPGFRVNSQSLLYEFLHLAAELRQINVS